MKLTPFSSATHVHNFPQYVNAYSLENSFDEKIVRTYDGNLAKAKKFKNLINKTKT